MASVLTGAPAGPRPARASAASRGNRPSVLANPTDSAGGHWRSASQRGNDWTAAGLERATVVQEERANRTRLHIHSQGHQIALGDRCIHEVHRPWPRPSADIQRRPTNAVPSSGEHRALLSSEVSASLVGEAGVLNVESVRHDGAWPPPRRAPPTSQRLRERGGASWPRAEGCGRGLSCRNDHGRPDGRVPVGRGCRSGPDRQPLRSAAHRSPCGPGTGRRAPAPGCWR